MNCVVVCVGSDKISGDALGPLVGSLLRTRYRVACPVFGVEGCTVNGLNLPRYKALLAHYYPSTPVIAVDAALGTPDEVGCIRYRRGGVQAGGALGRQDATIGDVAVLGVVASKGGDALGSLLAVPFGQVEQLAERIAKHLATVLMQECALCG